ncbi:MAG: hypothetical protein ACRCS9_05175 [Hyphomicrobium sp.]
MAMASERSATPPPFLAKAIAPDIQRATLAWSHASLPAYSICTLVSDFSQHAAMRAAFEGGGFDAASCEFLWIDNTRAPQTDAYHGLNALLNAARAPIVILCHQDVRLIGDTRADLDQRLAELTTRDPAWALAGNAGGIAPGRLALRISDPHGADQCIGPFPARVVSLDENFIVVRRDARIGFSHDLAGFHFYGADICLHAAHAGYSAYVIDFHLQHLSPGRKSRDFELMEAAFRAKWSKALAPRWIQTTCALIGISGVPLTDKASALIGRSYARVARRLPGASGWVHRGSQPQ